ncbi:MAG: histidine--tRNA ligase [Thermoanaerobaculia bacterium]
MSGRRLQAPKGTRDLLPPDTALWSAVEATARRVFARYGYGEIRTPLFEETELFARGVGEASDIVGKEMYSFVDKGERQLTLRPENTASVVRAYVEHGMHRLPPPVKLFYIGPQFRYERPQKGRYRQFHQIGAELIGGRGAEADAEVVLMLVAFLGELGFRDLKVLLNTVGDEASRATYRASLVAYLRGFESQLSDDSRRRLDTNPLRILDSKSREEQMILEGAPKLADSLSQASREQFARVRAILDAFDVAYEVTPRLVRGLDYYTNTVFEIVSEGLGSQNAICGGGAYEGLVEELGGPPTYAVGFAIGEDRLLEVLPADSPAREAARRLAPAPVMVVSATKSSRGEGGGVTAGAALAERLRRAGVPAVEAHGKLEKILERAKSAGSPVVVLSMEEAGEGESARSRLELRVPSSSERREIDEAALVEVLRRSCPLFEA